MADPPSLKRSQFPLKGAVQKGLEQVVEALAAGGLGGFESAKLGNTDGEGLLQIDRRQIDA